MDVKDLRLPGIWKLFEPLAIMPDEQGFVQCPIHKISHHVKFLCAGCKMDRERNI